MRIKSCEFLIIICSLFGVKAWATIDVLPKILELKNEMDYFTIINNGDKVEFLQIEVKKITNPGVEYKKESYINLTEDLNPTLIYSPFKLVLSPKQKKKIKFKKMMNIDSEEVYRVNINPTISPEFNDDNAAGVVINIGFGVLLRNYPTKVNKEFTFACKGDKDRVINKGNIHISARYIQENKKGTIDNIYPGQDRWFEHGSVVIDDKTCSILE